MYIEENIMTTMVTYSKDRANRYLLTKKWNDKLPKITVIRLISRSSGVVQQDVTTICIINYTPELGFGSIDIKIVKVYMDKAKSAKTDNRPWLQQMIKDSKNGNFSYVIVYKLDSF